MLIGAARIELVPITAVQGLAAKAHGLCEPLLMATDPFQAPRRFRLQLSPPSTLAELWATRPSSCHAAGGTATAGACCCVHRAFSALAAVTLIRLASGYGLRELPAAALVPWLAALLFAGFGQTPGRCQTMGEGADEQEAKEATKLVNSLAEDARSIGQLGMNNPRELTVLVFLAEPWGNRTQVRHQSPGHRQTRPFRLRRPAGRTLKPAMGW